MPEHADELLARALEALEILVLPPQIVLQPLHEDRVPDPSEELHRLDRLVDVHHPAGLEAGGDVLRTVAGGDEDDRDVRGLRVGLQEPRGLPPVEARHHDVHEDQIGLLLHCHGDRVVSVAGGEGLVAVAAEAADDQLNVRVLVVDDEHAPQPFGRLDPRGGDLRGLRPDLRHCALGEVSRQHGAKLGRGIRLRDEVIASGLARALAIRLHRERGHCDDRDLLRPRLLADRAGNGPAVELRQQEVDQHRVRTLAPGQLETGHAIRGGEGLVSRAADDAPRDVEVVGLVFDDEDAGHQLAPATATAARTWTGMVKLNTLPPSMSLSTQIRPPCSATRRLLIARPSPVPP